MFHIYYYASATRNISQTQPLKNITPENIILKEWFLRKEGGIWEYKDQILTCFTQLTTSENFKESQRLQSREGWLSKSP